MIFPVYINDQVFDFPGMGDAYDLMLDRMNERGDAEPSYEDWTAAIDMFVKAEARIHSAAVMGGWAPAEPQRYMDALAECRMECIDERARIGTQQPVKVEAAPVAPPTHSGPATMAEATERAHLLAAEDGHREPSRQAWERVCDQIVAARAEVRTSGHPAAHETMTALANLYNQCADERDAAADAETLAMEAAESADPGDEQYEQYEQYEDEREGESRWRSAVAYYRGRYGW